MLSISNQKNERRAQTIHQEGIHQQHRPVRAVICRVEHILVHTKNQNTIIGTFFTTTYPQGKGVTAAKINKAIKSIVKNIKLKQTRITSTTCREA